VFQIDNIVGGIIPPNDGQCRFDASILEQVMKEIIEKRLDDMEASMADSELDNDHSSGRRKSCPAFVVATNASGADGPPAIFRSYDCDNYDADKCRIWEAARCTTAAPTFFRPMFVRIHPRPGQRFLDGGLRYNNPSRLAIAEAKHIWPTVNRLCLVSIGTGWQKSLHLVSENGTSASSRSKIIMRGSRALRNIVQHIVDMSTNSEPVHRDLLHLSRSADPTQQFPYFRFNVQTGMDDIPLEEWKAMVRTKGLTSRYMAEANTEREEHNCVKILWEPPQAERM
jgi:predicted acylesterase/phospholipase RssA